ncbi:hypothetical protein AB0B28_09805 [Glycomyces sp. NPDC046736]|uniref:hypothetical protein n=1 Tax=Glycomyces sp. NPDC046736 TaxID=3155615 RepID=UPI0033E65F46
MTHPPHGQPAGPPPGPTPQSFQYQPHDPYGHVANGQPSGPVLPPAPTFWQRWGMTHLDGRPRQVTVLLQALWIYLAALVLSSLLSLAFSAVIAAFLDSGVGFAVNLVFSLLLAGLVVGLIWVTAREQLGRLNFENPRLTYHIGLGILGLNALFGLIGAFRFVFGLIQLAAVGLAFALIFTKPFIAWMRERPGNQPRKAPQSRPLPGEDFHHAPPQQSPWRDAAPGPGHAGPPASGPTGWPQPPR